jgi:hypothetical protein
VPPSDASVTAAADVLGHSIERLKKNKRSGIPARKSGTSGDTNKSRKKKPFIGKKTRSTIRIY